MNRYLTRGVSNLIPLPVQLYLWLLYDQLPKGERDWLQIFRITPEENHLNISHEQEVPEYKRVHQICGVPSFSAKVYIIDDRDHETMLLADEY